MNLKFCDRDVYLALLKSEAEAQAVSREPIDEPIIDDETLANEIGALRAELRDTIARLRGDLKSYLSAIEDSLS